MKNRNSEFDFEKKFSRNFQFDRRDPSGRKLGVSGTLTSPLAQKLSITTLDRPFWFDSKIIKKLLFLFSVEIRSCIYWHWFNEKWPKIDLFDERNSFIIKYNRTIMSPEDSKVGFQCSKIHQFDWTREIWRILTWTSNWKPVKGTFLIK